MASRRNWTITSEKSDDDPELYFLTATNPEDDTDVLYASARQVRKGERTFTHLSLWQTEDGEHVDDHPLTFAGAAHLNKQASSAPDL